MLCYTELMARNITVVREAFFSATTLHIALDFHDADFRGELKSALRPRWNSLAKTWDLNGGVAIAVTGTPMLAGHGDLAGVLSIAGHLNSSFGGWANYMDSFTTADRWGNRTSVRGEDLREQLTQKTWVRRVKADVLPDLPPKDCRVAVIDGEAAEWRAAWRDAQAEIMAMDDADGAAYGSRIGIISRLREATGAAKTAAAIEVITEWLSGTERPLLVWAHHRSVIDALVDAIPGAAKIDGSTSHPRRVELVDAFQNGELRVLICSITAVGVGVTLTAASDALFVERDWSPTVLTQAEDRLHRPGQDAEKVTLTTLHAPGTLDDHIARVLDAKASVLATVTGGDVTDGGTETATAVSEIWKALVAEATKNRKPGAKKKAAT